MQINQMHSPNLKKSRFTLQELVEINSVVKTIVDSNMTVQAQEYDARENPVEDVID